MVIMPCTLPHFEVMVLIENYFDGVVRPKPVEFYIGHGSSSGVVKKHAESFSCSKTPGYTTGGTTMRTQSVKVVEIIHPEAAVQSKLISHI